MIIKVFIFILISSFALAEMMVSVKSKNKVGPISALKLEHIAVIKSSSQEDINKLKNIIIDASWKSGQSVTFPSRIIVQKIQSELMSLNLSEKPKYEIPKFIFVESSLQIINEEEVTMKVLNQLKVLCNECEFKIKLLNLPKINGESFADVNWSLDLSQIKIARNLTVPIDIYIVDQHKKLWVNLEVQIFKTMPVATRQLNVGQRVQPEDILFKKIEVVNKLDWIESDKDLIGQALDKPITFGWPIYKSDLKREPAINRGQVVRVSMGSDNLEVTTQAYAESQGFIGDTVNLKTVDGSKLISGKVTEKGIVRIE